MKHTKYITPEDYKPRNLEILGCLLSQPQWLKLLNGIGKPYEKLLDHIIRVSKLETLDSPEDSNIKVISEVINVKTAVVSKWIPKIYEDLLDLNSTRPELFKGPGQRYELIFQSSYYFGNYFTLWLPTPLQKYDQFTFSFISAKIGESIFWVENVDHNYFSGLQSITAILNPRKFNMYREHLLDQAEFYRLISIDERYYLMHFQMDERLREIFEKFHNR